MSHGKLVHKTHFEYENTFYEIAVYCNSDGHHYAETNLSSDDIIINDGPSLDEVLRKHANLLPLAISSHKFRKTINQNT